MASFKLHMKLKSARRKHSCSVCEKQFNNRSVMILHKRLHFDEQQYKCLSCNFGTTCLSSLKSHYQLHKQQSLKVQTNYEDFDDFDFNLLESFDDIKAVEACTPENVPNQKSLTSQQTHTSKFY